ncbi:MAG: cupredoxin domain-containing protein [Chloroflexota bacterium]|nr:cupredoxin domain-containing protein [Chloroflexota bacterium]
MEYVQTVLARIQATKFDEATGPGGLFSELDAHRGYLASQPGFYSMQITRSANPEGDVLVVVETRWSNNNALADYSTSEPNVASIINSHSGLLVPNSVQVHRMEADAAPSRDAPNRVYDRLALAVLIPLGVLALAALVIFGLSRIYLVLPGSWATPLAAAIALSVLGVSWYFATHPYVPRVQIAGLVVVLIALGVSGIAASIYDDQHAEKKHAVVATPVAQQPTPGGPPSTPGAVEIDMGDNFFQDSQGGDKNGSFTVAANSDVPVHNKGTAVHNVHVAKTDTTFAALFCKAGGDEPCAKPASVAAGGSATLTVNLSPGSYEFRCDFHPTEMKGTLVVQ